MRGGEWNEPSVTAEHQHVNMLTLAFSLYFYTCRPFILSTVYSPCVDFLFCFKWSNVNHVKGAVTVLLHASQTKCHLDNSEAYAGSHCAEFKCILNCYFLCFWMCFSHSLELSFLFSFFTEWKAPGPFCKQVQQYIKGEQSTHKWKNLNEWCMAVLNHGEREKTESTKDARAAVRWAVEEPRDWQDRYTHRWWMTCLSCITTPQ